MKPSEIEKFREELQQREFRDYIADRYHVPADMPSGLRVFCACLKMVDRLKRQDMVWHYVQEEGPISEQHLPYIDTLLKLRTKDKKRLEERQNNRQISIFEQTGGTN